MTTLPTITLKRTVNSNSLKDIVFYVAEIAVDEITLSVRSQSPSDALLRAAIRWRNLTRGQEDK